MLPRYPGQTFCPFLAASLQVRTSVQLVPDEKSSVYYPYLRKDSEMLQTWQADAFNVYVLWHEMGSSVHNLSVA